MIIAIDGPSGTGKSTVAKGVAKRLGFSFFETGAMYRAVAWQVLQAGVSPSDQKEVAALLPTFTFSIKQTKGGERRYWVGDRDITDEIRSQQIASIASQVATYPEVRTALVKVQRAFGESCDAVFEGRDMGTVVFPEADLKIFLTAASHVRAQRRYQELLSKFPDLSETFSYEQILKEVEERDHADANRPLSPLKQASDAILLDCSHKSAEQVIEEVISLHRTRKRRYPKMQPFYRFIYLLAKGFFRLFYGLKIYGVEHIRKGGGLLIANHASFYDPPVLSISCPEEVHFLARETLFHVPLLGPLIRRLNTHPISRGTSDLATFKMMTGLLKAGHKLILFPEGKRSYDGELAPFERGLSFLVQKSHCRIFPAYLEGTFRAWPRGQRLPRPFGKIRCVFGAPIEWSEFEGLDKKEADERIIERAQGAVRALKDWLDAGARGLPP